MIDNAHFLSTAAAGPYERRPGVEALAAQAGARKKQFRSCGLCALVSCWVSCGQLAGNSCVPRIGPSKNAVAENGQVSWQCPMRQAGPRAPLTMIWGKCGFAIQDLPVLSEANAQPSIWRISE